MDGVHPIKGLLHALLKARKVVRMYPENNQVYIRTVDTLFERCGGILDHTGAITLHVRQDGVFYDGELVAQSRDGYDTLPLLLFKEGLRELTLKKFLSRGELEAFLRIISLDERELIDVDLVTLLWEKDFQHISYVVDDNVLSENEEYDPSVTKRLIEHSTMPEELFGAYRDACNAEHLETPAVPAVSEGDLQDLMAEFERDSELRLHKFVNIIFELYYQAQEREGFEEATFFMRSVLDYLLRNRDLEGIVDILHKTGILLEDAEVSSGMKASLSGIVAYAGSSAFVREIGALLDSGGDIDENTLFEYAGCLGSDALQPLIDVMGGLQKISARKRAISLLAFLGKKDLPLLLEGLHDSRWHVVRNIICVARLIGERSTADPLIGTLCHLDARVRREAVRTLGEMRSPQAASHLGRCFSDPDPQVRLAAVRALRQIRTDEVKQIFIRHLKAADFIDREYEEKRSFAESLSLWRDREVIELFSEMLVRRTVIKRAKNQESRACAAYALGLTGDRSCVPLLRKYREAGASLLQEQIDASLRRLGEPY